MAVQRMFNCTTPFREGKGGAEVGGYARPREEEAAGSREETGGERAPSPARPPGKIQTWLLVLKTRGSATEVGGGDRETEKQLCPSIVTQAELEGHQEFTPTRTEHSFIRYDSTDKYRPSAEHHGAQNNVARPAAPEGQDRPAPVSPRAKRRRRRLRRRRCKEKEREAERERRERRPSGVPEQESSLVPGQEAALECSGSSYDFRDVQNSGVQETESLGSAPGRNQVRLGFPKQSTPSWGHPQLSGLENGFDSNLSGLRIGLDSRVSGLEIGSDSQLNSLRIRSDSHLSSLEDGSDSHSSLEDGSDSHSSLEDGSESQHSDLEGCELAVRALRGSVGPEERCFAAPLCRALEAEAAEEEGGDPYVNEGILFHPEEKLQHQDFEYREGRDYTRLEPIQNGSFGDVYRVRDNSTEFICAAKKIPLDRFRSEEVGAWSALKSPRVVELFGAVREGPNIILFMDLKSGSLGGLLRERGRLPEDLSLHYLRQVLGALKYLHGQRVLHMDIKVDNVLLSEDGKDTFLCDFGHSERLDLNGRSAEVYGGGGFHGTETHMAPEVARGERHCDRADVWSSCCMLLHMRNGCHPWTRLYSHPLCLKIANEPPPLNEIPSDSHPCTVDIFIMGLQKDPNKRASAAELREKTTEALKAVGGLTSSVRGTYQEPASLGSVKGPAVRSRSVPSLPGPAPVAEETPKPRLLWVSPWRENALNAEYEEEYEGDEETGDEEEAETEREPSSPKRRHPRPARHARPDNREREDSASTVSEVELKKLSRVLILDSLSQPHSPETLLSCLSNDCPDRRDPVDKDSRCSVSTRDDLSSGVFSYNSQTDGQSFNVDYLLPVHHAPFRCFEGVDVCIEGFDGQCLRIRERPRVKVGHVAVGISEQISKPCFSLEALGGRPVSHDEEVLNPGVYLRCTPAPDGSPRWRWRVREGRLEVRD